MIKLLLSILILLFIVSCGKSEKEKVVEIPAGIVSKETMVSIVVDLSLFESARGINLLNKIDTIQNLNQAPDIPKFHESIFTKYGVNRMQYDSSFNFYSQNPELLLKIYDEAINQLSQAQSAVNK